MEEYEGDGFSRKPRSSSYAQRCLPAGPCCYGRPPRTLNLETHFDFSYLHSGGSVDEHCPKNDMSLANAKGAQNRPQHVPAWKRIGLKLKYAKNSVEDPSDEKQNGFQSTTRSNEDNHGNKPPQLQFYEDGPPAKKRRTLTEPARDSAPEPQQRVINKIPIETSDNSSRASQDVAEDYGTFSNDQDDLTKTTTNQR